MKTSSRKTWKVPGKGALEFDYHTAHPCETLIEHLTFDLQKPREKAAFLDLWTRASHLRGQNLWNCKLGTRVMQIPESLYYEKQLLSMLPSSGILSFDYIYCVPKESTKRMVRFSMRLQNLTDRKDRADLATLVQRAACSTVKDEFMINIRVNDGIISQSKLASEDWQMPKKGSITFDIIRYLESRPIAKEAFASISEEIAQQSSSVTSHNILSAYLTESKTFLTCEMVSVLMKMDAMDSKRLECFKLLVPHIVDPPNALHFCLPLLDPDSQMSVRNWVATGDLKRTEKKKKKKKKKNMVMNNNDRHERRIK